MGRLGKAIAAVKDQTSIHLARANSVDVAIVKATCHEEDPADECFVHEILTLTAEKPLEVTSCVNTISQRLNKTRNWVVALKTLILVHRLLQDGNPKYQQEIFFATRRGTRLLNMSDFRDTLKSNTWDYAAFVRAYALFLDEQLEYKMQGKRITHSTMEEAAANEIEYEPQIAVPVREMNNDQIFARFNHISQLLERFVSCRPAGRARQNRLIMVALYPVLTQSFLLYYELLEIMGVLIERLDELTNPQLQKVHGIYCRVAKQCDELDMFYDWCKSVGIARTSEYPEIEKIPQKNLDELHERVKQKLGIPKQDDSH